MEKGINHLLNHKALPQPQPHLQHPTHQSILPQHNTTQHNTTQQLNTLQHNPTHKSAQHSIQYNSLAQHGTTLHTKAHNIERHSTTSTQQHQHNNNNNNNNNTAQHSMAQHSMAQHSITLTTQHDIQHNECHATQHIYTVQQYVVTTAVLVCIQVMQCLQSLCVLYHTVISTCSIMCHRLLNGYHREQFSQKQKNSK